jgi:thymidylate kinase
MTQTQRGVFLVLEGISGAGKSTLAARFASLPGWIKEATITPDLTGLLDTIDVHATAADHMGFWLALQYAIRARIEPELLAGRNVVLESYVYRTIASHSVLIDGHPPKVNWSRALEPDLAVLLDAKEPVRLARIGARDAAYAEGV